MNWLAGLCLTLATTATMELVAYLAHRYVMHGWLWSWHASHHAPRDGLFERNDRFALVFALLSIVLVYWGHADYSTPFWIGWGMAGYGLIYFIFHDGMVHQRLPVPARLKRMRYLKHLVQAHRLHHASHEKDFAVSYGFLYAPPLETLRQTFKKRVKTGVAPTPPKADDSIDLHAAAPADSVPASDRRER